MESIKIPKLKSTYIPVHSVNFVYGDDISWWKQTDEYNYPFVLFNLDTITSEDINKLNFPDDMFLLTDSGGFQVIRGTCNYDWKTSLEKQISLNATKIFSFDKPPVKRLSENSNQFISLTFNEATDIIKDNLEVGLKQSQWLKENYPEMLKRFCFIAQCPSVDLMLMNLKIIEDRIGMKNYSEYFPGGIVMSCKGNDLLLYTMCAYKFKKEFIEKGMYVHSLGIGSFQRMALMIRNEITTFDSSNVLRGAISWDLYNPINPFQRITGFNSSEYPFISQFCSCPTCMRYNYNQIHKDTPNILGRIIIKHNLWHQLSMNILLDSIDKKRFTKFYKDNFKITAPMEISLNFCDDADTLGFEMAYSKYKCYLQIDKSKQKSLF
jgi:hypothetical protein